MNIRFLGTGFGPLKAKKNTKDYRRPASLLVDESILLDITSQTIAFAEDYSLTSILRKVRSVLVTSVSEDRFSAESLIELSKMNKTLTVYGDPSFRAFIPDDPAIRFREVKPGEIFDMENAKGIALPTLYATEKAPAIGYAVCTDRSLLYLTDGGFLHPDAWDLLKKLQFDLAVLGCPQGDARVGAATVTSANLEMAKMLRSVFTDAGTLTKNARCFLSSIPMEKKRSVHDSLVALIEDKSFSVAYDGLYFSL